ncbi:NEDD4 family-interacting protein 2-like [Amphiura filiformis]|uniref:NEDD4 family-interacting protein 2-like n=1 Tax=Amphiura filiformis TaxID=82378 RepID=UPI003B211342
MEEPPKYEEVCRDDAQCGVSHQATDQQQQECDQQQQPQRLTLALIVPPPSPADTSPNSPAHNKEAQTIEIPDEPPPPYVADDRPLLKDDEESYRQSQAQRSLEQKLVQAGLLSESDLQEDNGTALGNDLIFIIAFSLGFLFNWIGFLFAYCLCFSIAGRYGAISGMGASMIKWTFIAMYTDCCDEYMRSATCLMIALLLCGVLIFARGIYMYAKIKNQIARGMSPSRIVWYHM